jgi:hypothetical protein
MPPPPVCDEDNDDFNASDLHWQLSRRRHPRTSSAHLNTVVNAIPWEGGMGGSSRGEDNNKNGDEDINDNWTEYVSFIIFNCYAFAIYI